MAKKRLRGGQVLLQWRRSERISRSGLGIDVGDPGGEQIRKFEAGRRELLPLPLAARVSARTGLPLESILTEEQTAVTRLIFSLMARDAALPASNSERLAG